ncbi:MAG: NTP transferase domain-containing protein [Candidatus Thorarchaeota archaeon]
MEEVVIVAGGLGIRLEEMQKEIPKTLLRVGGKTILDCIIATIEDATKGKYRLFIAAGYYYDDLKSYIEERESKYSRVDVVEARNWMEGNASTLLAVEDRIENDDFILQMSDHLFTPETYKGCIKNTSIPLPFVCGQPRTDGIPDYLDLDDATKVLSDDSFKIIEIGKDIEEWNMIDMGVFRLTKDAFSVIASLPNNQKSLSQYVMKWRSKQDFYVNPQPQAIWKDIDTPMDLQWAIKMDLQGIWKS